MAIYVCGNESSRAKNENRNEHYTHILTAAKSSLEKKALSEANSLASQLVSHPDISSKDRYEALSIKAQALFEENELLDAAIYFAQAGAVGRSAESLLRAARIAPLVTDKVFNGSGNALFWYDKAIAILEEGGSEKQLRLILEERTRFAHGLEFGAEAPLRQGEPSEVDWSSISEAQR